MVSQPRLDRSAHLPPPEPRLGPTAPPPADLDARVQDFQHALARLQAEAIAIATEAGCLLEAVRQERRAAAQLLENPLPDRLSVKDVARRLSLSKSAVYRLLDSGRLTSVAVRGRRMIPAEAYRAFLAATEAR
jgi:excisionase family DNA binding protein